MTCDKNRKKILKKTKKTTQFEQMPEEETPETDKRGPPQTAAGRRQKTADRSSQRWPENRAEQQTRRHRQLESNLKLVLKGLK